MTYVVENNQVLLEENIGNGYNVKTFFDTVFHTEITYSSSLVTVEMKNYLNEHIDYTGTITLTIDEAESTLEASNGFAFLPFTSTGYNVIRTNMEGIRNGELTIGTRPVEQSNDEVIASLMLELADTQSRLFESEQTTADLTFQLIEKGVL